MSLCLVLKQAFCLHFFQDREQSFTLHRALVLFYYEIAHVIDLVSSLVKTIFYSTFICLFECVCFIEEWVPEELCRAVYTQIKTHLSSPFS